ncbi:MAG: hypothetical protein R6T98_03795 [Desulfatiglandales bacterium]
MIGFIFSQFPEETEKGNQPKANRSVCGGGGAVFSQRLSGGNPGPRFIGAMRRASGSESLPLGEGKTPS